MKIVADQRIPYLDQAFGTFGTLVKLESGAVDNVTVRDADALIVRSETRVDEKLLAGSNVSFVGTATIGTDHVDAGFLSQHGIEFASAPGSNANAVVQYVFAALFAVAKKRGFGLWGKTIGVVGVGNVGSRVVRVAKAIGMNVLENDPPLARAAGDSRFVPLDELSQADIITLHVPLTKSGSDPTFHLFDEKRIFKMKSGAILVNSSRGGVTETGALKKALTSGALPDCVLDVWEHEPNIDLELVPLSAIATPHIAGYSIDGKVNATKMVYTAFCNHFKYPQTWDTNHVISPPKNPLIAVDGDLSDHEAAVATALRHCYEIERDDEALRKITSVPTADRGLFFKKLRGNYILRHELSNYTVDLQRENSSLSEMLKSFGFKIRYQESGKE